VGPIECVEFSLDRELCENFAWVVFKHACSVDDSIRLFHGTSLYGLPIDTKKYSEHLEHPVFDDQLNYFKQLIDIKRQVEHSSYSNDDSKNRWNDQSSNNIPDCLPEPPMHNTNLHQDNYKSDPISKHDYKDRPSTYQFSNVYTKSHNLMYKTDRNITNKTYHDCEYYQQSDYNDNCGKIKMSKSDRDSYNNRNHKYRDYNSSNWKEKSTHQNEDKSFINENNSAKDELPVRDLRDTIDRKHSVLGSDYDNVACTSQVDLRDTLHRSKSNKYEEDSRQRYESNSKNQYSERNHKSSSHISSNFIDEQSRKNNYSSECYNELKTRHQNHYTGNREYYNHSCNKNNSQEYSKKYPNNYNGGYNKEKNKSKQTTHSQNMESNSCYTSYPYKRNNESYDRKEYKHLYNEQSGHNFGKNYGTGTERSRQNYYS